MKSSYPPIKSSLYHYYMDIAKSTAKLSYCERAQVGSVVVTRTGAMYSGYNGTIAKYYPNVCELPDGSTAPYTAHSEENCFYKMLREGVSAEGSVLFVTTSPCEKCARMIVCSGVSYVVYLEKYRDDTGLEILRQCEVGVTKYNPKF